MRVSKLVMVRLLAGAALAASGTVAAQEPAAVTVAPDGRQLYDAAYFAQYAPSTALDIVQRIPGFTLETGDADVRGFGGAAGNLVIDGARPSAKSDSLATILSRIPAARVLRVEVGSGDLFSAEYSGRPRVANLVLRDEGGLSGTIEASLARGYTGSITPQGNVSALLRRGASTFTASLGYENADFVEEGTDTLRALPSRAITEFRIKENDIRDQEWFATASWALDRGENRSAHLNGRFERNRFTLSQTNDVRPAVGPRRDDRLSQFYRSDAWEIGGDVTRPLGGGGVKLIGLYRTASGTDADDSFNIVGGNVTGGFVQLADYRRDEAVARLLWSRANLAGWSIETGFEAAYNRLDSDIDLFGVAAGGALGPIDLPVDEAIVSEIRGEAFVNAGRALTPRLRADLGLIFEASRLTVEGDAQAERSLRFLKPKVSLDWRPGNEWRVQASLERTVAQLDFGDFVGAAELSNDRVDGGNPDLLPQRAWEARLSVERPVLGDGRVSLLFGYNAISLLQDRIPLPDGGDAPGNLGDGRAIFVTANVDLPLTRLGWRGARFTAGGTLRDTSVIDPYTGLARDFSGVSRFAGNVGFRQDFARFAYGFNLYAQPRTRVFRRNEIDAFDNQDPYIEAFAEYRASPRTTVTLNIQNLGDLSGGRRRTFFAPDRSNPVPFLVEDRIRNRHIEFALSLRHSFG